MSHWPSSRSRCEVDYHRKVELLAGARALVNPIRWDEPFGLVMVEALACGTPVVATHHGAAPELVDRGLTGFIAGTVTDLAAAANQVEDLDRQACRDAVERAFSMRRMAADHAAFYRTVVDTRGHTTPSGPHERPSPGTGPSGTGANLTDRPGPLAAGRGHPVPNPGSPGCQQQTLRCESDLVGLVPPSADGVGQRFEQVRLADPAISYTFGQENITQWLGCGDDFQFSRPGAVG
jgi:hypothetical protein